MYRTVVIGVFATVVVLIAADLARRVLFRRARRSGREADRGDRALRLLRLCVNVAGGVCLAAVTVTGFAAVLANAPALGGYLLMAHVTTAGGFAGAALAVAVVWVSRNWIRQADWELVAKGGRPSAASVSVTVLMRKVFFWMTLASAVPTLATALLAMFPLASPAQQQVLLQAHRISALLLVACSVLFAYCALAAEWDHRGS
ncbi:MAG: hypothetical protein ABSC88_05800 [Terracidiphilus sp.]